MPENPMTAGSGSGLPQGFNFPHFSPFSGLPLDPSQARTNQQVWDSQAAAAAARFHALHGLSVSGSTPSLSELSLLAGGGGGLRRSGAEGGVPGGLLPNQGVTGSAAELHAAAAAAYSRLTSPYMDPLYAGIHTSPTASLRLSDSRGSGLGLPPDYMSVAAASGFCPRSIGDLHPGASTLSSAELAFAFDNARFASPRASVNARANRKRALSCSPYSDSFDLNSMIRFSPNSLVSLVNGSRGSSASGSYGHLSAGTMSPAGLTLGTPLSSSFSGSMPPLQQLQAHLLRSNPLANSLPGSPFFPQALYGNPAASQIFGHSYLPNLHSLNLKQEENCSPLAPKASPGVGAVSSTMDIDDHCGNSGISKFPQRRVNKVRREPATTTSAAGENGGDNEGLKDEPGDFVETNCHWTGCSMEFCTQEELVAHIYTDHIQANKKVFVCRWKDCSREEKPFKAQYMLVVHMRRHTGEKPHRCTFEGCLKAYSRLENLKTHLRSHTGEKPYTCEYPGCIKAFSNASDRAKHQNRTHSNEKPYVCKAPGCTKRYTDPSSLRKHVKTVHGADFYASKKHKGNDHSPEDRGKGGGGEGSPRSEDMGSKATSLSSPSIKSEDPNSPHNGSSPGGESPNGIEPMEEPISDNNVSTTGEMDGTNGSPMLYQQQQHHQPIGLPVEEDVSMEVVGNGMMVGVGAGFGQEGGGFYFGEDQVGQRRFRARLGAKGGAYQGFGSAHGPGNHGVGMVESHGPRRNLGIENLNRRIHDLKMESPSHNHNQSYQSCPKGSGNADLMSPRLPNPHMQTNLKQAQQEAGTQGRRDSGNSTLSSQHASSRRSSSSAQARPSITSYDPISPGSSRRSSALSTNEPQLSTLNSLASSSNTLTSSVQAQAHLERLHRRALGLEDSKMEESQENGSQSTLTSSGNYLIQSQTQAARMDASWATMTSAQLPLFRNVNNSGELRRMSDPCTSSSGSRFYNQAQYAQQQYQAQAMRQSQQAGQGQTQQSFQQKISNNHNQEEDLNFLIPDEMANYLSECNQRPSTCPPPNTQHQQNNYYQGQIPPPPPYNQAVHQGAGAGAVRFGQQGQGWPANVNQSCQYNQVQSPYSNQPMPSPAYSHVSTHSHASSVNVTANVMSPKGQTATASPRSAHQPNGFSYPQQQVPPQSCYQGQGSTPYLQHQQQYPQPQAQQYNFNNPNANANATGFVNNSSNPYCNGSGAIGSHQQAPIPQAFQQPSSYPQTQAHQSRPVPTPTFPQPQNPTGFPQQTMQAQYNPVPSQEFPVPQPPQQTIPQQFNRPNPPQSCAGQGQGYNQHQQSWGQQGQRPQYFGNWPASASQNYPQGQGYPQSQSQLASHGNNGKGQQKMKMSSQIQCKSVTSGHGPSKNNPNSNANGTGPSVQGMRAEAYQRTLEYVQQCQQQMWVNKEGDLPLSPDSTTDPGKGQGQGQGGQPGSPQKQQMPDAQNSNNSNFSNMNQPMMMN